MIDPKSMTEIIQNAMDNLPDGLKNMPNGMRRNLRDAVQGVFDRLDLVTREEFDVQAGVLLRTREKLEALEKQLDELEQ